VDRGPVESYLEQVLASQDLRFQAALVHAASLYHYGTKGAQFEEDVRAIVQEFLPANYRARDVLLDADDSVKSSSISRCTPERFPCCSGSCRSS
jgi:hypothetical protein